MIDTDDAKLDPFIWITVPPILGPNAGVIELIVDVNNALYWIWDVARVRVWLGRISCALHVVVPVALTGTVLYICPSKVIYDIWHWEVEFPSILVCN